MDALTTPQIGVVIPAYNSSRFLKSTLDSVLEQSFAAWECVVIDDGSSDDTREIAEEYAERDARFRVVSQPNRGIVGARNAGFAALHFQTSYVIFLDHDDVWESDALETLRQTLESHPEAVAAHGSGSLIDSEGHLVHRGDMENWTRHRQCLRGRRIKSCKAGDATSFAVLAVIQAVTTPGMVLMRRRALEKVGLFDSEMAPADDWDLLLRLSRLSDILFVDRVVLKYRQHPHNFSKNEKTMRRAILRTRKKLIEARENSPRQHQIAVRACRAYAKMQARQHLRAAVFVLGQGEWREFLAQLWRLGGYVRPALTGKV